MRDNILLDYPCCSFKYQWEVWESSLDPNVLCSMRMHFMISAQVACFGRVCIVMFQVGSQHPHRSNRRIDNVSATCTLYYKRASNSRPRDSIKIAIFPLIETLSRILSISLKIFQGNRNNKINNNNINKFIIIINNCFILLFLEYHERFCSVTP